MAWIEARRNQFRVYERTTDGKKTYEPFATRGDAELFKKFAAQSGWDVAVAAVRAPTPTAAAAADVTTGASLPVSRRETGSAPDGPSRMPPPALPAAGLTVGRLVGLHIEGLAGVEQKTVDQYTAYVRDYIDPYFGDLDAGYVIAKPHPDAEGTCAVAVTAWRAWLDNQPAQTRTGPHASRKLSGKTKKNIMSLASAAYNSAMAADFRRLVDRNPMRGGARGITGHDTTERTYLTVEQALAVYAALLPGYQLLFMFLLLTGLRWGEAAGLRVKDVCLEPETGGPYLDVKVGLKRPKGGGWMLGRLKSQAARRRLTLPPALVAPITAIVAGKGPEDLVLTSVTGRPLHHSNFCRELARAISRAREAGTDVPDFTPHNLRHTCAAWLLSTGRTLYQASKHLGHESEATTGRHYGHLLHENRDENADALDKALGNDWHLAEESEAIVELSAADQQLPEFDVADLDHPERDAA